MANGTAAVQRTIESESFFLNHDCKADMNREAADLRCRLRINYIKNNGRYATTMHTHSGIIKKSQIAIICSSFFFFLKMSVNLNL